MYNETLTLSNEKSESLTLDELAIRALTETRKWTTFLAVLGTISTAIMLIAGLIMGLLLPRLNLEEVSSAPFSGWIGWAYLILALITIIPLVYIFRFNGLIKRALQSKDSQMLGFAFSNLNLFFRTIGIITIVFIVLYIGIIGGVIFFSLLSF
ncbi:MAG: hypothetical protein RBR28_11310 [Lentimicrobium sp.]|nr:hypothetical protein [Lentimicrobium sp.]